MRPFFRYKVNAFTCNQDKLTRGININDITLIV